MSRHYVEVTKTGTVERAFRCEECGLLATALVTTKGRGATQVGGLGGGYVDDAYASAAEDFRRNSVDVVGLTPCPRCGERNHVSIKLFRAGLYFFIPLGVLSLPLIWSLRSTILVVAPLLTLALAGAKLWRARSLWRTAHDAVEFVGPHLELDIRKPLPQATAQVRPKLPAAPTELKPTEPRPARAGTKGEEPSLLK